MSINKIFLFIFLTQSLSLLAQDHEIRASVYHEEIPNGSKLLVDNEEYCPISVQVNLNLTNMKSTEGNNKVFVVPARSKKYNITDVIIINTSKAHGYGMQSIVGLGDYDKSGYDEDFNYYLPYKKGDAYTVNQGYNGIYTHKNKNSLDFDMPIGTEIHAAREGVVVKIEDSNNKHCLDEKCMKYDNFILVYQSDGTFASYAHIKKNGAAVKEGDSIAIGQLIAYSGDVGYSNGPHLHFDVSTIKLKTQKTVKTVFLVGDGQHAEYLVEKNKYERKY
ncbi:MAG: family peptidase [Chitinophagaceae bacterium]|nr:family peptidase [Chitinophagaceae bacterium]